MTARGGLPMAAVKNDFLRKVRENEVVVVSGETGCGKTTQVDFGGLFRLVLSYH